MPNSRTGNKSPVSQYRRETTEIIIVFGQFLLTGIWGVQFTEQWGKSQETGVCIIPLPRPTNLLFHTQVKEEREGASIHWDWGMQVREQWGRTKAGLHTSLHCKHLLTCPLSLRTHSIGQGKTFGGYTYFVARIGSHGEWIC